MRFLKKLISYIYLKYKKVDTKYGDVTLNGFPLIIKNKNAVIKIGKDVTLNSSLKSNFAGINHRVIIAAVGNGARIVIGDGCGVSGATLVAVNEIFLENRVGLGANTAIYDTDFHPVDYEKRMKQNSIEEAKSSPVYIGEGTLIGANSVILKGVNIGKRSFIGANSVVTKNIEDDILAVGNPIKIIKKINCE